MAPVASWNLRTRRFGDARNKRKFFCSAGLLLLTLSLQRVPVNDIQSEAYFSADSSHLAPKIRRFAS